MTNTKLHNTAPEAGTTVNRVLISGGGTGGHIFPALSIANAVKRRYPDADILFVGAQGRMEMERVPAAGYPIEGLPVAGFDRKRLWRNFGVLIKLWKSLRKARRIVRDFKPDIAIGVGGYASGPVLKQAQKQGVATLLQEQNSYAGVTNKLLAKKAKAICVAYDGMERFFPADVIVKTGNPVRSDLEGCQLTQAEAKKKLGFDPDRPLVLTVGGSLGARTVNEAVAASLPMLHEKGVNLMWQTGRYGEAEFQAKAKEYDNVKATTFISDMATAYRAADLVVSRAGAGTISELQNLAKACILIPSPNVAEDHQRHNAEALSTRGGAVMILDADAVGQLPSTLADLMDHPEKREALSREISGMALRNADEKIVDKIVEIIKNRS
ncbi:MAG: undecaprenyldiphospho-muramoylpentapeptide beta-N-acetylglucosaminyltransferase [Duncaniella sp.]|uniref:undecaprenyldiphospho-muramoylpentapeptide beta-N-acetylglucosaminyltransferase n=1 Tax=Duncaniella sp. TaxID=2518496 RepID=UPI0023D47842|nr:undecaprenyldiphospho-muramoylpentapeptide beta-N-acetylglucosaminyltransferase [Duncaniella sp.]MDE6091438.1 undecaprenyldiphospho-muramoylpentapeptide beta-N-acetylglucosaminyltransferase [Duncaniella sp.]